MTYREPHDFPSQEAVPGYWWQDDIVEPGFTRNVLPPSTWDDRALAHIRELLATEAEASLFEEAHQLLAIEETDAGELKKLHRDPHSAPDETIWPLLIAIMQLDTEKHIRILKGIERHPADHRWPH